MSITTTELAAMRLLGDVFGGEVRRIADETFLQVKSLVVTEKDAYFVTMSGRSIPIPSMSYAESNSQTLSSGGLITVELGTAFLRAAHA